MGLALVSTLAALVIGAAVGAWAGYRGGWPDEVLMRTADFLPLLYGFAIVSMLLRVDCKRLGDLAAATLVVHEPGAVPRIALEDVAPVPPARPLSPHDQAAVIALAARARRLTPARLDELASLAASVSGDGGRAGPEVTRRVLGVAQWLLGRRA